MSWEQRKPDGVGDVEHSPGGWTTSVSIPLDEDGYFGRDCPTCEAPFKMLHVEYQALPDDLELTCPYCGHREEHSAFMSAAQRERVMAAASGLALQFVHQEISDTLARTFGSRSRAARPPRTSGLSLNVETSYRPGTPPPIKALPDVIEKRTRRIVECSVCGNHHAVYSATSFCPVCGPRPATDKVLEAIAAARAALAIEDRFDDDERETLRANGVFERWAVDGVESVVSLFELFAREQFTARVSDAREHTKNKGNVFQRPDDTAALFREHAGIDLPALNGADRWQRFRLAFAQRHVLVHNGGIIDEKFHAQAPGTSLKLGQRLVVRRIDAETALDDLHAVVETLAAA